MVWDNKTKLICMLCPFASKKVTDESIKYFPTNENPKLISGEYFEIEFISTKIFSSGLRKTKLRMKNLQDSDSPHHELTHMHETAWEDD